MILNMLMMMTALLRDRKGVSSLEYVVLAVGIIGAVSVGATNLGTTLTAAFTTLVADLGK
ncbi:MAG: hypothetical protein ABSC06_04935 [Rhodopila sp.]|jgi:Flp pilus assembly pilin Flp